METNLNKKTGNPISDFAYSLAWIVAAVGTTLTALGISVLVFVSVAKERSLHPEFYGYHDENGNIVQEAGRFTGTVSSEEVIDQFSTNVTIGATVIGLISICVLVVLMIFCGRWGSADRDKIRLNWHDRIWSEVHLALLVGAAAAFCGLFVCSVDLWTVKNWFGIWKPASTDVINYGISNEAMAILICAGIFASVVIFIASLLALVKKLKAHQFWEKSLIGGFFLWLYRLFKNSTKTMTKILGILILGALLSATWFGLPVVLILIIIFVPKLVNKFIAVREGVEQVKSGNLNYKIPVEEDTKGVKGELDKLAGDINEISMASSVAVQNELKNQRMKTELISNVSHDLKTPLTSMVSYIDLLKKEGLDSPNAGEYLDIIDSKTQRLKTLTENLFEAAKASSGAIPVNMTSIDMASLVNQGLGEMDGKLSAKRLEVLVKNTCAEGTRVMADGQLLWRVIENLLGNVCKYALEGSRVYIDMSKEASSAPEEISKPGRVLLEVKNISAQQLNISADELMERFKRGDESRNTEGSGLGLAIAKDLVNLMGGNFRLKIDGDLFKACVMLEEGPQAASEPATEGAAVDAADDII